jgi:hypothetical protein
MMKAILFFGLCLLLIAITGGVYAASEDPNSQDILLVDENYTSTIDQNALGQALTGEPSGDLNKVESEDLLYMVEEEKLAGDVYSSLSDKWNLRVFSNIIQAERTHETSVKTLLTRYSLPDPTQGAGKFSNGTLQKLHDDLVIQGSSSEEQALMVGAAVEEIDIKDLEERISRTDRADIQLVYANLKRGSENHLRAFVNNLQKLGVKYSPQYLSTEEYQAIIGK